jgi:hypothetical protein
MRPAIYFLGDTSKEKARKVRPVFLHFQSTLTISVIKNPVKPAARISQIFCQDFFSITFYAVPQHGHAGAQNLTVFVAIGHRIIISLALEIMIGVEQNAFRFHQASLGAYGAVSGHDENSSRAAATVHAENGAICQLPDSDACDCAWPPARRSARDTLEPIATTGF